MATLRQTIEALRPQRNNLSPWGTPNVFKSFEKDGHGGIIHVTTVFLIGAECRFRCTMCDLWKNTLTDPTPEGAIPEQINKAFQTLSPDATDQSRRWLKLYNASNFFDSRSVPTSDLPAIADLCKPFERVVVENHPRLCDERILGFAKLLSGQLEVAMGLETVHPKSISLMNKDMTLAQYEIAMNYCKSVGVDTRVFVLMHPPGVPIAESNKWTWDTVQYALDCSARHVSIIPVRSGNGWVDEQVRLGSYRAPDIGMVDQFFRSSQHASIYHNINAQRIHRVDSVLEFDLWDWELIEGGCPICRANLYESIMYWNSGENNLPLKGKAIGCECKL